MEREGEEGGEGGEEEREVRWRGREGKGWRRGREEEEKKGGNVKKTSSLIPRPKEDMGMRLNKYFTVTPISPNTTYSPSPPTSSLYTLHTPTLT